MSAIASCLRMNARHESAELETIESSTNETNQVEQKQKRVYKYDSEEERHEASKTNKRQWYYKNKDQQKLKSLKYYYQNQLKKTDLKEETKKKYESKINEINNKLSLSDTLI